jgi:hypothetical protein
MAQDTKFLELAIPNEWCGATVCVTNTIHICNDAPGHTYEHECTHGGACGYTWIEKEGLPRWNLRDGVVYNDGKPIGLV